MWYEMWYGVFHTDKKSNYYLTLDLKCGGHFLRHQPPYPPLSYL